MALTTRLYKFCEKGLFTLSPSGNILAVWIPLISILLEHERCTLYAYTYLLSVGVALRLLSHVPSPRRCHEQGEVINAAKVSSSLVATDKLKIRIQGSSDLP